MRLLPLFFCIAVVGAASTDDHGLTDYSVCESDACREIGEAIRHGIDNSSDPCTNFYEYGCGLWPVNYPIPPSELQWSMDDQLSLKTNQRAKEILEEQSEYDDLPSIQKLKRYYRSCMDEDAIEKQGLKPVMALLDANGGWPIIMGQAAAELTNLSWQTIDNTYNRMFGGSSFFKISYEAKDEDSTSNILTISIDEDSFMEDELDDEEDKFLVNTDLEKMVKVIKAFAIHKGAKKHQRGIDRKIAKLFDFQEKFKEIAKRADEEMLKGLEVNKTVMTISELQEYYDLAEPQNATAKINWLETIQSLYEHINVSIKASEPVVVYNKELLHELAYLLDNTSPRVIVNFIQWNIVNEFLPFLNKKMRDIDFQATYEEYNVFEQKPRWETCVEDIALVDALSYLYIKRYNLTNNIKAVAEMIEEIKTEMKKRISHSNWTNNNMKEFMINKMDNLIPQIGYPDWYNNQTALTKRYEGLLITDNYFKNFLSSLIYEKERFLRKFWKPIDKYEWVDSPLIKNSFYDTSSNKIIIPAAEIQDPYFTAGVPLAINYGAIGMIVGHELAHSFDSSGIQYDKFGNKVSWNNKETNEVYDQKVKCFVDQYNNFTLNTTDDDKPIQINGLLTKNENIADNVGLDVAFAAFQKRLLTAGSQPKLPGLTDVTDEQLFFLSYVNAWCTTSRESYEEVFINTDSHTPPRFRTIGSMANMESFSNTFNCPMNSPMNREIKCSLWK